MPDDYPCWHIAISRLCGGRQNGMDINSLLFADICQYFDRIGFVFCSDFELFIDVIRAMDAVYVQWVKDNRD
jgi:hypothetical protein